MDTCKGFLPVHITENMVNCFSRMEGRVLGSKYCPSPIPEAGLKFLVSTTFAINFEKRQFLVKLAEITEAN